MRRQQYRVPLPVQISHETPQHLPQFNVHTGSRFVQHDDRRLVHQRQAHQYAPFHAARKLAHVGRGLVGQAQACQQFVNPRTVVVNTKIARLETQGLTHGKERIKHQLLRHDTQITPHLRVIAPDIQAVHLDRSVCGLRQTGQDTDQRGLACAIGPQQAKELSLLNVKRYVVQRTHLCCVAA